MSGDGVTSGQPSQDGILFKVESQNPTRKQLHRPITLKGEEIPVLQEIDMPSKESIVPQKRRSFPFINATPDSATERSHSRLLIRSHVGSWVWQQTKQNSGALDTDKVDDSHTQDVKRSTHRADWNSIEFEAATSTLPSASLTIGCQTPDLATCQTSSRGHDDNGLDLARSNNTPELSVSSPRGSLHSIDYISVGTLDPFQTYPSNFPPAFINWCAKYC
jgi:hypothetical protein